MKKIKACREECLAGHVDVTARLSSTTGLPGNRKHLAILHRKQQTPKTQLALDLLK